MITYKATTYDRANVAKLYIAATVDYRFKLYAVNQKSQTLAEIIIDKSILNPALLKACQDLRGRAFNQIEIPHDKAPTLWALVPAT